MDLQCAQCHDHPLIKDYKQADYFGLFAFLKQTKPLAHPQTKQALLVEDPAAGRIEFESVFAPGKHATGPRLPGGKEIDVPVFEKGQEFDSPPQDGLPGVPKFRPRGMLAAELASAGNSQFIRTSVNRFWFLMLGRGLVHPLDLDHGGNAPSHPELLKLLGDEFVAHGCNVKWLLRELALSECFGRSSLLPEGVAAHEVPAASFRVALARPLSPEQLTASLLQATGNTQALPEKPEPVQFAVAEYLTGKAAAPPAQLGETQQLMAAIFGGAAGEAEIDFQPSMGAALFLMNEKLVLDWLAPTSGNLVERLNAIGDDGVIAEELYLSVLSRLPDAEEREEVSAYLKTYAARRGAALGELAWALLASAEFRLNH